MDIEKFIRIQERFAERLRSRGEIRAAEAVESIRKYVKACSEEA